MMKSFLDYLKSTYRINKGLSGLSIFRHRKIYAEWKRQIEFKKTPLDLELPWITIIARNYIENYFKNKSKAESKIFEFGSGGSSLFFLKFANQVVSIEHDKEWFELVKRTVNGKNIKGWNGQLIAPAPINNKSQIILDASEPLHYYTTDETFLNCSFKNYASYIDNFPDNYFDIVLVDGRSRPSCLYHSLDKVKERGLLVLDNAEREYYLSKNIIDETKFSLVINSFSSVICQTSFSQTNIYIKK